MAEEGRMTNYMNTPLCMSETPFSQRYFGDNYDRLLKVKQFWDPENFINHCHSVGSTVEDCCV